MYMYAHTCNQVNGHERMELLIVLTAVSSRIDPLTEAVALVLLVLRQVVMARLWLLQLT